MTKAQTDSHYKIVNTYNPQVISTYIKQYILKIYYFNCNTCNNELNLEQKQTWKKN